MRVKLQFKAKLPIVFKKKDKYVVACCPILDVMSQGANLEEAKKNLGEALYLFFVSCYEYGTLDEELKKCGFEINPHGEEPEASHDEANDFIDVQIPLFSSEKNPDKNACHA